MIDARKCERCGQLKSTETCFERKFETTFNEVLCDECVQKLVERNRIAQIDENVYKRNIEQLYADIVASETAEDRLLEQIDQLRKKRKRMNRVRRYYEMNTTTRG